MEKTFKENEEAPSGLVYFYNYKEPLMKFDGGFGYLGALIHDEKSDQIQCHFCGKWFDTLQHHLHREHNMNVAEYKEKVGLKKGTALISERFRAKLIQKGLEKRLKNLRINKHHTEETKRKISATMRELRAEKQNITNTCPEQLLERLVKLYNEKGRTPLFAGNARGEVTFRAALKRVYGSVKNACEMAGIPYRAPGVNREYVSRTKWTRDYTIDTVAQFYQENKRLPNSKEYRGYIHALKKWGKKTIFKEAVIRDGTYKKVDFVARYDKTTLLTFLRMFEKNNGRKPSYSDCKRGLLPHLSRYSYNFGSWKNALALAFPK